jgi:hypothetical protein
MVRTRARVMVRDRAALKTHLINLVFSTPQDAQLKVRVEVGVMVRIMVRV